MLQPYLNAKSENFTLQDPRSPFLQLEMPCDTAEIVPCCISASSRAEFQDSSHALSTGLYPSAYEVLPVVSTAFPGLSLRKKNGHSATASFGVAVLFVAESQLETIVQQTERELGRELTPRETFYLALSEACSPSQATHREERQEAASLQPSEAFHCFPETPQILAGKDSKGGSA
jgi:hypothetical protein